MAEYGYVSQYRGSGGSLPAGYLEALTTPGRMIGQGIAALGQGIAQSLERYKSEQSTSESATNTAQTLTKMAESMAAPRLKELQQAYETGALPPGIDQQTFQKYASDTMQAVAPLQMMGDVFAKFPGMSSNAKKAAIGDMAMLLNQYQQQSKEAQDRVLQNMNIDRLRLDQDAAQLRQSEEVNKLNERERLKQAANFALENQIVETPKIGEFSTETDPKTGLPKRIGFVQEQISYPQARKDLADFMTKAGMSPESYQALDQLLSFAGVKRPVEIGTQQIPGVGTVVNVDGKMEIVKNPSPEDAAKQKALEINFPEFKGTAPTMDEAITFREAYDSLLSTRESIASLQELEALPLTKQMLPENKTRAQQLARSLQGAMRLAILGPGTVTEPDRQLLEEVVRDPTRLFSFSRANKASLEALLQRAEQSISNKAKSLGLTSGSVQNEVTSGQRFKFNPVTRKAEMSK